MRNIEFQSLEDVYDTQIEHLRSQQSHLKFMHEYHAWMMSELMQPMLIELHGTILDNVNEALKHLDQLIETLQPTALAETEKSNCPSD